MTHRHKVLLLIPHLGGGGAEKVAENLARNLSQKKYELHLCLVADSNTGDKTLPDDVTVHRIGGHSKGLQAVRVKTRRGHVVLAADASHLYSHINEGRVFPVTYNVGDVLEGYRTITRLADSPDHIVPGHDPLVAAIYPAAAPGLEGLVVRLDVDPKR